MRRALPSILTWGVLLLGSTSVFVAARLREQAGAGVFWSSPDGHFWIVSAASLVCVVLALAVGVAATQTANARVLVITIAFLSMAGIFTVHGLATPGFLIATPPEGATHTPFYNVTGFSSRLALGVCVALLAVAAAPWPSGLDRWIVRRRLAILVVSVGMVVGYAFAGLRTPWLVPSTLVTNATFAWNLLTAVAALGAFTAWRFGRSYVRTGVQLHGALTIGAVLLVQAQISMHFGASWTGTFWLYHLQLLSGFLAIFWGVVVEFSSGRAVRSLETLVVNDVIEQLRSGYTEPIIALSAALEARDGYTLGHGERVAALAVLIAEHLGISGRRLRGIAAGSVLHDVGKIGVPDSVLHKTGPLNHFEYEIIREHPARGAEMLRAHFDQKVEAEIIRHHHERWDGTGYPDRLAGTAIPLAARIAAVADVYDALRSNRAYRPAWSAEEAIAMIEAGVGSHFDPRCVEAFRLVVHRWEARYAADHLEYAERRAA